MNSVNTFFFAAGVLATVALLFVLYPWLAGRARSELLAALPRWVPLAGAGALAMVLAVYVALGTPQLNDQDATAGTATAAPVAGMGASATGAAAPKQAAGSMDNAVTGLEHRLAAGGGSDGDWELLAKSYDFLGRPDAAALARQKRLPPGAGTAAPPGAAAATAVATAPAGAAPPPAPLSAEAARLVTAANAARNKRDFAAARDLYAKLAARNEMNADTWADYADVTASLNGRSLLGKPATYLANALRLDPQHPKALWLQASMEHEARQYQAAVGSWQRLAAALGPDSPDARVIAANLAEDQRLAGGGGGQGTSAAVTAPAGAAVVRGEIVLADSLKGKIPAGLTLFVVAKSVSSPGPPVAIWRTTTTGSWPVVFQLDDSQAMIPMRKLSTAGMVTIEARTSRTGQAMPAPGDFQGVSAQLDPAAGKPVRIVIQKVIG
jgi:cytochrome c-type biogenesis protein CcmH